MAALNRIVGLLAWRGLDEAAAARARRALADALGHFPWLVRHEQVVGETTVVAWGHGELDRRMAAPEAGGLVLVAGETVPETDATTLIAAAEAPGPVPWAGRHALLAVAPDGRRWTISNDWAAAVPVFHGERGGARMAGTLEPAIAAGLGLGAADISRTGVVNLLTHGFYLGRRTLYDAVSALYPDVRLEWADGPPRETRMRSVTVDPPRAGDGWETLVEEMGALTGDALRAALAGAPSWSVPLSGGLDSRQIAAVGASAGVELHAFTYGERHWPDLRYARAVARELGIGWQAVPLRPGYLSGAIEPWLAVFGASLHAHGMYQFPLLHAVGHERPIAMGFTGDPLGGAQMAPMALGDRSLRRRFTDKWHMWDDDTLRRVLRFDPGFCFAELEADLEEQWNALEGVFHQRLWQLFQFNHMARFPTYQPTLHDWWAGATAPFVDRRLASFAVSLPRALLDDRRLQVDAFRHRYPRLATIPGTWSAQPAAPSGRFYALKTLADLTPPALHRGPLRQFRPQVNAADQRALVAEGEAALHPIPQAREALAEWIDLAAVDEAIAAARAGALDGMARVEAIQTLAYALTR